MTTSDSNLDERGSVMELLAREALSAQARLKEKWDRYLPIGDVVLDRWTRARQFGFGEGSSVYDSCLVLGRVMVGKSCWIGPFSVLDGSGGLTIGDGCTLSAGVHVYTHDDARRTVTAGELPVDLAPVQIGDHVYIGPNVVVARGVSIGSNSIIGANSLVLRSVPEQSVAWGTPCQIVSSTQEWLAGRDLA